MAEFPGVKLTILADKLKEPKPEVNGFNVVRCWSFGSLTNPVQLLRRISELQPDVVWFNIGFA